MIFAHLYPIHCHAGTRYNVCYEGDLVVERSLNPECDLARVLEARGLTGNVTMLDGLTGMPRTVINIAKAAKLKAAEDRKQGLHFTKWTPFTDEDAKRTQRHPSQSHENPLEAQNEP